MHYNAELETPELLMRTIIAVNQYSRSCGKMVQQRNPALLGKS